MTAALLAAWYNPALHAFWTAYIGWPVLNAGLSGFLLSGAIILSNAAAAPARIPVLWLWNGVFHAQSNLFYIPFIGSIVCVLGFVWSVLFWRVFIARFSGFFGIYDPFRSMSLWPTAPLLRTYIRVREWFEILLKFGKGPSGGWASFVEVMSRRWKKGDIFLGRQKLVIGGMLRPVGIPTVKHMVTIAGTGSGKSTAGLVPNLCIHEGSLLCIDVKGELAAITADRRGRGGKNGINGIGQDVYVLDPFGIVPSQKTASYNVFDEMARVAEMDIDRPVSYAMKVGQALVKKMSEKEKYWDNAAETFITGLVLYIFTGPKEQQNLVTLRRLLMEGDTEGLAQAIADGDIKPGDLRGFDVLLEKMRLAPEGPYRHVIAGAAETILKMKEGQFGAVVTTVYEHTSFLDLPEIMKISMKSDFLLEDLKDRKISVYLCLPITEVTGKVGQWLRMFILLLIDMMVRNAKPPKPPILLAIDEFPNLGYLDGMEVVAPVLRSYGIRLWVVGQDIEMFQKTYPDSWGGFIGGAEAAQFMGITHPETVDFVVKRLGRHVVTKKGGVLGDISSVQPLLDADQVARILAPERKNQIIWRGSSHPMLLKIAPYFEYLPCWYYAADARHKEKWKRHFWRWGGMVRVMEKPKEPVITKRPSSPPPEAPPVIERREKLREEMEKLPGPTPEWIRKQMLWAPETEAQRFRAFIEKMEKTPPHARQASDKSAAEDNSATPASESDIDRQIDEWNEYCKKMGYGSKDQAEIAAPESTDTSWFEALNKGEQAAQPASEEPPGRTALEELDALTGLQAVKDQIRETVELVELARARERLKFPKLDISQHMVFTGNPGTGKTMVARLVGQIYKEAGLLPTGQSVEVDRGGLVGEHIGWSEAKTKAVIDKAMGGVLFIDEAYSLTTGYNLDFGVQVVAALIKAMEDHRDKLVVIVAGYKEEMARFIASNPGLESRFRNVIDFPDYSDVELVAIFADMCRAAGCSVTVDGMAKVAKLMGSIKRDKGFGNARTVRNIFGDTIGLQARRLKQRGKHGKIDLATLEAADIPDAVDAQGKAAAVN